MKTKKIALYGMLIALAFIFNYIERSIEIAPGIKLGIANLVVMMALYLLGTRDAFFIAIIRVVLVGLTFGNLYSMIYSLAGSLLSFGAMWLLKKTGKFGTVAVSVVGGVFHNIGQVSVAMIILGKGLGLYLFVLLFSGIVAGIVIGLVAGLVISRLRKYVR